MAREQEPGMPSPGKMTSGSGKWSKYVPRKAEEQVSYLQVDMPSIMAALVAITEAGGALLFSKTRDGGAYALTVCQGDERAKFYATSKEELEEHLGFIVDNA